MITSLSNKSVKEVIQLSQKPRERNKQGLFVVEGVKMFREAPTERIRKVYIAEKAEKELRCQYQEKLDRLSCEIVSDEVFSKMSDTKTPQGVLCLLEQYHYGLEQLLAANKDKKHMLFILLENIQDPGNLGTILRTGEGAGVDGVIMSRETADIYNPKTIRSTMGSVYRVPFLYTQDIRQTMKTLQEQGISIYAAHLDENNSRYYYECDYRKHTAFLIGNEGNGLNRETADCADCRLKIPMEGSVESLNAAVAAAVLMYEAYRQRKA
jgi:TrmH family RNA methyltransferase